MRKPSPAEEATCIVGNGAMPARKSAVAAEAAPIRPRPVLIMAKRRQRMRRTEDESVQHEMGQDVENSNGNWAHDEIAHHCGVKQPDGTIKCIHSNAEECKAAIRDSVRMICQWCLRDGVSFRR